MFSIGWGVVDVAATVHELTLVLTNYCPCLRPSIGRGTCIWCNMTGDASVATTAPRVKLTPERGGEEQRPSRRERTVRAADTRDTKNNSNPTGHRLI